MRAVCGVPATWSRATGGEEFACILPATDLEGALAVAADIERAVRALKIAHADSDVSDVVTVSIGASMGLPERDGDPALLLALADGQLYRAKRSGRGRACGAVLGAQA